MHQRRHLAVILLAFPGVFAAHILAYQWVNIGALTAQTGVGHDYLPTAIPLVASLGAVTLIWLAVAGVRAAGPHAYPPVRLLAAFQLVLFTGQELGEHLFTGHNLSALLVEPAFWLGFMLQVPMAFLLVGLVRIGRRVAAHFLTNPTLRPSRQGQVWSPVLAKFVMRLMVLPVGLRGPPLFV